MIETDFIITVLVSLPALAISYGTYVTATKATEKQREIEAYEEARRLHESSINELRAQNKDLRDEIERLKHDLK